MSILEAGPIQVIRVLAARTIGSKKIAVNEKSAGTSADGRSSRRGRGFEFLRTGAGKHRSRRDEKIRDPGMRFMRARFCDKLLEFSWVKRYPRSKRHRLALAS